MGNLAHKKIVDGLWLYGTSFTYGLGCNEDDEYHSSYFKNDNDLTWWEHITADQRELIHRSDKSGSNLLTIKKLTEDILNIIPTDIVIIEIAAEKELLKVNSSQKYWRTYFTDQVKALQGILYNRGVRSLMWYSNENNFETISKATDNKLIDNNYSFEGHRQCAEFIKGKILNKKFFTKSLI